MMAPEKTTVHMHMLVRCCENNIDIKIYKSIFLKNYKIKMYAEIENAFNDLTLRRINPFTGRWIWFR